MSTKDERTVNETVEADTPMKEWLVNYVGEQHEPGDDQVTVEMIVETMAKESEQQQQQMQQMEMLKQAGQLASSPMMDPSKNEAAGELIKDQYNQLQNGNNQGEPPAEGGEETTPEG